ncbi:MAG: hypothetical protein AB7I59_30265 [Geminicoccaceae bacterium]
MLPEALVEELSRPTPLQQKLVELAWPSLATESRLQVLMRSEPTIWLASLALSDEQPIVRFWAARTRPSTRTYTLEGSGFVTEEKSDGLEGRISDDPCDLVRAYADSTPFLEASQLSRLVRIRGSLVHWLDWHVEWMISALEAGVPEQEVAEFAVEVFEHPFVKRDIAQTEREEGRDEGYADYKNGEILPALWKLFGRVGSSLRSYLLWRLPFKYRGHTVGVEDITKLPADALLEVIHARGQSAVVRKAKHHILKSPEKYPADLVAKLRESASDSEPSDDELYDELYRKPAKPIDPQQIIRNEIEALRAEVGRLRKELATALAALNAPRRRWF